METIISATKLATGIGASACLGIVIDDKTHVPMGVAVGVCLTVYAASWWLSHKFTKIGDQLSEINRRLDRLPCDKNQCGKD